MSAGSNCCSFVAQVTKQGTAHRQLSHDILKVFEALTGKEIVITTLRKILATAAAEFGSDADRELLARNDKHRSPLPFALLAAVFFSLLTCFSCCMVQPVDSAHLLREKKFADSGAAGPSAAAAAHLWIVRRGCRRIGDPCGSIGAGVSLTAVNVSAFAAPAAAQPCRRRVRRRRACPVAGVSLCPINGIAGFFADGR